MVKILLSEDHELYRDGLRMLLHDTFSDIQVLESDSFLKTKTILAEQQNIALVLFDINMPGTSGLNGLKEIKAAYPALPLVVVSTVDCRASIQQMLQLGADGFISKTSSKAVMIQALRDAINGEMVVINGHDCTDLISLSPRQIDTLALLAKGLSNKEIATKLNISVGTVRDHVSDILHLFECDNRTQLVLKACELGYILA
jgi:DNA-binding NarL/FixJ family response regulator